MDEVDWEAEWPLLVVVPPFVRTLEVRFPEGGGGRGAGL